MPARPARPATLPPRSASRECGAAEHQRPPPAPPLPILNPKPYTMQAPTTSCGPWPTRRWGGGAIRVLSLGFGIASDGLPACWPACLPCCPAALLPSAGSWARVRARASMEHACSCLLPPCLPPRPSPPPERSALVLAPPPLLPLAVQLPGLRHACNEAAPPPCTAHAYDPPPPA